MTSWFDKTLRRMSFQMGSLQAGTRPQGQSQPPEVQEFKKMLSREMPSREMSKMAQASESDELKWLTNAVESGEMHILPLPFGK